MRYFSKEILREILKQQFIDVLVFLGDLYRKQSFKNAIKKLSSWRKPWINWRNLHGRDFTVFGEIHEKYLGIFKGISIKILKKYHVGNYQKIEKLQ